jgi:hypothetical protein
MLASAGVKETLQRTALCGSTAWRALAHLTEIDQSAARACGAFERETNRWRARRIRDGRRIAAEIP